MYISAIKNYFSIKGRINRRQYLLVLFLTSIICGILAVMIGEGGRNSDQTIFFIFIVLGTLLLLPSKIKRCHDLNWSGLILFVYFLLFIPGLNIIPFIVNLLLLISAGSKGKNEYGVPPHLQESDIEKVSNVVSNIADKTTNSISDITQKAKNSVIKSIAASIVETQKEVEKQKNLTKQENNSAEIKEIEELKKRILELEKKLTEQKNKTDSPITNESNKDEKTNEDNKKDDYDQKESEKEKEHIDFAFINKYLAKQEIYSIINENEVEIMRFRLGISSDDPKSIQEVANKFNITREEARQIEEKTIKTLMDLKQKGGNLENISKEQAISDNDSSNNLTNNENSNNATEPTPIITIILVSLFFVAIGIAIILNPNPSDYANNKFSSATKQELSLNEEDINKVISLLNENKVFKTMIEINPDYRQELKKDLLNLVKDKSWLIDKIQKGTLTYDDIVGKLPSTEREIGKYIVKAPDEELYQSLLIELKHAKKNKCQVFPLTKEDKEETAEVKTKLILAAVKNPYTKKPISQEKLESIMTKVANNYKKNGGNVNNLAILLGAKAGYLTPTERCNTEIGLYEAMISLPKEECLTLYRESLGEFFTK